MSLAQALFAPRSVALVGASGDAAKNTARPQRYLKKHGYRKNLSGQSDAQEIFGDRAYAASRHPETVDRLYLIEDVGERSRTAPARRDGERSRLRDAGQRACGARRTPRARPRGVRLSGRTAWG
jgi:hypothetical protein